MDVRTFDDAFGVQEETPVWNETRWKAFLSSWKWAAMLGVGCLAGLIAIVSAHPFGGASVSQRVSARLGKPAACTEVGVVTAGGVQSKLYRCVVGIEHHGVAQCFTISGGDVKQLVNRRLGC